MSTLEEENGGEAGGREVGGGGRAMGRSGDPPSLFPLIPFYSLPKNRL